MCRGLLASIALSVALVAGCPGPDPGDVGSDARVDAPSCMLASECDDGRFCNGAEACAAGVCVPGTPPDCDDGIACTADRCSEGRRRCENDPTDEDGDGYGATSCAGGNDCDDADPDRYPGNFEVCDPEGNDEDCNDTTFGGIDDDLDGFESSACCNGAVCGDDCDDARNTSNPNGTEVCNGLDDDCSGMVDEGVGVAGFVDADADGYGSATPATACVDAPRFTVTPGDCDDDDVTRSPGLGEVCDGVDNDCDPNVDEMALPVDWFVDTDGDGFGARGTVPISSCAPIAGRSRNDRDCDDGTSSVSPRAVEVCNALDDDCNGVADFRVAPGDFEDDDGDRAVDRACVGGTDCDDRSALVGSGDGEVCDGRDNDCDMRFDEDAATSVFFPDRDGDGFGDIAATAVVGCMPPAGYVARGGDCDDRDAMRSPAADEGCNGRDEDCDGAIDESAPCSLDAACTLGACRVTSCRAPRDDCDRDGMSCETNVETSTEHCGACGRSCSSAGASSATCAAGACTLVCAAGRSDCDRDGTTGCEADTATSLFNCGGCGRRCDTGTGDTFRCAAGACSVMACRAGRNDCDGRTDNGCETTGTCPMCGPFAADCDLDGACNDLGSDPRHCGACGRACIGPAGCLGGTCERLVELDVGNGVSCGRYDSGRVVCWGGAAGGVRGPEIPASDGAPVPLTALGDVVQLAIGDGSACAVRATGRVACWGDNTFGQLGPLAPPSTDLPVEVGLPLPATEVGVGLYFSCALLTSRQVFCWGTNHLTALDPGALDTDIVGPLQVSLYVEAPDTRVDHVLVGEEAVCGWTDFGAFCTGGAPNIPAVAAGEGAQYALFGVSPIVDVTMGGLALCARYADGSVACLGSNADGALGTGFSSPPSTNSRVLATELSVAHDAVTIQGTTCGISALGTLRCVGDNRTAMTGTTAPSVSVLNAIPVTGLPAGSVLARSGFTSHLCALSPAGRVYCWGANDFSQCGGAPAPFVRGPRLVEGL